MGPAEDHDRLDFIPLINLSSNADVDPDPESGLVAIRSSAAAKTEMKHDAGEKTTA